MAVQPINELTPETPPGPESSVQEGSFLQPIRMILLLGYSMGLAVIFIALLVFLVDERVFAVTQTLLMNKPLLEYSTLATTLLTVLVAGTVGGTLCNLSGLFTQVLERDGRFRRKFEMPFYLRPLTGSVTGLLTFFVGNLRFPRI